MSRTIDPKLFGLHPTTILKQSDAKSFALVINRKSRVIMKDGRKIVQTAALIIGKVPGATVSLRTSAPVCSKTRAMLAKNNVELVE